MSKKKYQRPGVVVQTAASRAPLPVNDRLGWVATAVWTAASCAFFIAGEVQAGVTFASLAGPVAIALIARRGR
ncbi:hypothetical protein AB0E69_33200 [Kribbella sp. NPDC026611]|uniref:hypothetical protein n=1 Tax=Kribbella sp. NPDC026611 TaxID=3154911 RepID=UPI0033EAAB7C